LRQAAIEFARDCQPESALAAAAAA